MKRNIVAYAFSRPAKVIAISSAGVMSALWCVVVAGVCAAPQAQAEPAKADS